jgi:signal transduction histidine kinase
MSDQRRELAQTLIATRESTLREIARELHDELGQLLTAMGSMLGRAARHAPEDSALRADLREVGEVAQTALDNVRGLSQTLHPSILEELGLDSTIAWYLPTVERQLGVTVNYERSGEPVAVDSTIGIHVYRVLQEALSNVAKHSGAHQAWVRLSYDNGELDLDIEDHGRGLRPGSAPRGLGVVAMRERAALLGGSLEFLPRAGGGTIVKLRVPIHATAVLA